MALVSAPAATTTTSTPTPGLPQSVSSDTVHTVRAGRPHAGSATVKQQQIHQQPRDQQQQGRQAASITRSSARVVGSPPTTTARMPALYHPASTSARTPSTMAHSMSHHSSLHSHGLPKLTTTTASGASAGPAQPFAAVSTGMPHPQYPFIPSPHPHNNHTAMLGYPATPMPPQQQPHDPQLAARLMHQAQMQQQQWHMDNMMLMKQNQTASNVLEWQNQLNTGQRQRAVSGPTPSTPSPQFHTTPLPYPPSPSPTLHYKSLSNGVPPMPLPPGAAAQHYGHGYPTPPGSVERGEAGQAAGNVSAHTKEAYHPYRRGEGRSASHPRGTTAHAHGALTSISSTGSNNPRHLRGDSGNSSVKPSPTASTASSSSVYASSYSVRDVNSSSTSVNSAVGKTSARSTPPPPSHPSLPATGPALARARSDQQLPDSYQDSRAQHHERSQSSSGSSRSNSFESARAATPVGPVGKKPSPLGRQYDSPSEAGTSVASRPSSELERPGTPGTLRERHREQDEDSDDTADPNQTAVAQSQPSAVDKPKKGVKGRFKKAFGLSSTPSAVTLTADDLDGRGPTVMQRVRSGSTSSEGSAITRRSGHMASASTSTAGPKPGRPPTVASTRKFGLLSSKFNSSTDNLSISSTVSSASMLIRKLGNVGKMARRNSFMNLTKAFKSKDKDGNAVDGDGVDTSGKTTSSKDAKKKSSSIGANVSHVTAEVDRAPTSTTTSGMSPAAALAKRQQQMYAEQEAAEAAAAAKAERERLEAMNKMLNSSHNRQDSDAVSIKSSRSFGNWTRSKDDGATASKMLQKEKDKLKKSKGRRWGFGSSDGSKADGDSISVTNGPPEDGPVRSSSAMDYYDAHRNEHVSGIEVLNTPAYATYSHAGLIEPSVAESARQAAQKEQRRQARPSRGILKGAGFYSQEDFAVPRPAFDRTRASSFDAPQQQSAPGPSGSVALVGTIPSESQVDGVAPASTAPRSDAPPPADPHATPLERPTLPHGISAPTAIPLSSSPFSNPALNSSAPTLAHLPKLQPIRSSSAPGGTGRRITFATSLSVHTTWPANVYDRRAEPATCNRLTPLLAQQIKEELNSYKMEEMDVHPSSRALTHFFV
ncbi:hypothetical protein OIV83_002273 [Microbotryomycetes sp. JL201]|nr:hypothetical protein OIV83_002273 [Microbotryomycetes sp. JL201]